MGIYQEIPLGHNLSQLVGEIETQHENMRSFERGTVVPTVLVNGSVWNQTDYAWSGGAGEAWKRYNGTSFVLFLDPRYAQICAGGTVPMAANLVMSGNKITGLADGSSDGDAAAIGQVILLDGSEAFTGNQSMGGHKLTNLGAPTSANDAARLTDIQTNRSGVGDRDENPQIEQQSDHAGTYQPGILLSDGTTRVMPLLMHIRLSGAVTKQSDASAVTTLTEKNYLVPRHDETTVTLESVVLGVGTLDIILEWKTTAPHGFWLRLVKSSDGAFCNIANKSVIMLGAKGEG